MNFPVTQVFNFFNRPDEIVEYANSLEYPQSLPNYPGRRTDDFAQINYNFFKFLSYKVLKLWYNENEVPNLQASWRFHKTEPTDTRDGGWLHKDGDAKLSIIIYLNKNMQDNGTSIFVPKKEYFDEHIMYNGEYRSGVSLEKEGIDVKHLKDEVESRFLTAAKFNSIYNSAVIFDSNYAHQAHLSNLNETRLTLLGFIHDMQTNRFPIPEMRKK